MRLLRMRYLSHRAGPRLMMFASIALVIFTIAPAARTEEPPVFAITNARIVPVSGPVLNKGTVILRNGVIEAVGTNITIPGDARVIDASGMTVYPGLIDALSDIGLEEARPQAQAAGAGRMPPGMPGRQQQEQQSTESPDEQQGLTPYRQGAELLSPTNRKIESARAAGITTTLLAPRQGFFPGQSSLVNLGSGDAGGMVVKTPVAFHINLANSGGFGRRYPGSLMGIFSFVKQTLLDARHYDVAWNIYNSNPGAVRPQYSRALEALQPMVKGQAPVVLPGDTPVEIQRALDMAESYRLKLVLSGGAEAGGIAAVLKERNVPVLLTAKFPERQRDGDPEAKEELDALRRRLDAPATAGKLAKAGVKFAFQSDDMSNFRDFMRNVRRTVEAGLDKDQALRALTMNPAEIFGVADRLGSIEKNKTANLIVATGDLFDSGTSVKYAFVDGHMFEIVEPPEPERPGRPAGGGGPTAAMSAAGSWTINVDAPQGPIEVVLNLQQSGPTLTGTASSALGASDLYEGTIEGGRFKFKLSVSGYNVTFNGTVQGDRISGTVDAGEMGVLDFSGSKNPRES